MLLASSVSTSSWAAGKSGVLLVANQGDRELSIVDPGSAKQVAQVPEGAVTGHEVTASRDGKLAYVPIYGSSGVGKPGTDGTEMVVIDVASRKVTNRVDFGHGVRPHCPVLNPKDGMLYVTTELDQSVTVIDPKTLKIVGAVPTGQKESHMLAISHDGRCWIWKGARPSPSFRFLASRSGSRSHPTTKQYSPQTRPSRN